tara:strand:- start:959 stop:1726 length:768 start_codon:yes stop_codon:yes gene_type:complete
MVPNGNTSGVILTVDNVDTKQLGLGFIANEADQTNAIGKLINNNTFNAVFGVNVTLTLGTGNVDNADTENRVFQFGEAHNLTITPHTTTAQDVLDALNALPIFPSTMLLPGGNGGALAPVWSLATNENTSGNVEITDANNVLQSDTDVGLVNNAKIHLIYENSLTANSKISYVAVTHESGGTDAGVSLTDSGNNFIVLENLTNEPTSARPLPTLVAPAGTTDAIFAMSGITNTTGTNGNTSSVSSLVTTEDVTID